MVFYTCSGCGESLKKNKVDNHAYSCRHCEYVTCMDCSKDFYGDDYKAHTSCITEDQKYAAKGTEFKPNKGDVKQQEWCKQIEDALTTVSLSDKTRDLLTRLASYDNVPRKQSKFINFVKNSLRVYDVKLCEEAWGAFSSAKSRMGATAAGKNETLNGQGIPDNQSEDKQRIEKKQNDIGNESFKTENGVIINKRAGKAKKKKRNEPNQDNVDSQSENKELSEKNQKNNGNVKKDKQDKKCSTTNGVDEVEVSKKRKKKKRDPEKLAKNGQEQDPCSLNFDGKIEQTDIKKSKKKKKRKKEDGSGECPTKKKKQKSDTV